MNNRYEGLTREERFELVQKEEVERHMKWQAQIAAMPPEKLTIQQIKDRKKSLSSLEEEDRDRIEWGF